MKLFFLMLIPFIMNVVSSCSVEAEQQEDEQVECLEDYKIRVSFPKGSGLLVDYHVFEAVNDTLFEITASRTGLVGPDEEQFTYDTIAKFNISAELRCEMIEVLRSTDSLGSHYPEMEWTSMAMGAPRFFINVIFNDKEMRGYLANCYREHIFRIIDVMNKCHPKENVLDYNKENLIRREQEYLKDHESAN